LPWPCMCVETGLLLEQNHVATTIPPFCPQHCTLAQ
jgi:hypothetical protein